MKFTRELILQRDDERPSPSGRPSLLSDAQPSDTSRSGILHGLEGKRAAAPVSSDKRATSKVALAATGAAVVALAVVVGAVLWMNGDSEPVLPPVAAAPAAPAVAEASAPAPAAPVATIVEETAAVSPPADNTRSLKDMLNDTPATHDHDALSAALERPHPAPAPAKVKLAEHKKAEKPAKKPVQVAKKSEAAGKAKTKPGQDSDVTLLAALMAHVQAGNPGKAPSTPAYQLKQCKLMNEAGAAQCREHLCSTTARNEPECKAQPVAVKTAAES
jgi:hypothetical protein